MNTGLQDAYNLAWKLALVVEGRAGPTLLDTYEQERLPVAQRLLRTTDRAFQLLVSDGWPARLLRTKIIARVAARAMTVERIRIRTLAFRTISQIGIRYRRSPLSVSVGTVPKHAPQAGDRFPWLRLKLRPGGEVEDLFAALDDTGFSLLAFGQSLPADVAGGFGDLVRIHEVPADPWNAVALSRAHVSEPSFYLLRPDGHVALSGTQLAPGAVERYVADWLVSRGLRIQ